MALDRSQSYWTAHAAQCAKLQRDPPGHGRVQHDREHAGKSMTDTVTMGSPNLLALNQLVNAQQYCLAAAFPFIGKNGAAAATTLPDGTPGYIGLLADCANVTNQRASPRAAGS